MTSALAALHDPVWQRVGVALIHFVWQGLLIAAAYQLWIELFRVRRPESRYLGGLIALALMAVCPLVTWAVVDVRHDLLSFGNQDASAGSAFALGNDAAGVSANHQIISWIVAAWLVGVAILGLRVAAGLLGICWLMGRGAPAPAAWQDRVTELCRLLGLRTAPHLVVTTEVYEALAAGFFRPFIVVPSAWLLELPTDVLEAVLAHELAHIRRWDLWVNLAQRIIESLLFYHPAVWWLSRTIRTEREMCCDELAVSATEQRVTYVSALETVARRVARLQLPPLTVGMGGVRMALLDRVRNVLGIGAAAQGAVWWPVSILLIGICLALWITSGREPTPLRAADGDRPPVADDPVDGYAEAGGRPRGELVHWAPPPRRGPPPEDWPPPGGPPRDGDRRGPPPDGWRPDPNRRPPPERRPGDRPESEVQAELMQAIRDLHAEVAELRRDVREIRDRRPPPLPRPLRDLLDSLPRDQYGRPSWGGRAPAVEGPLPRDQRPAEDKGPEASLDRGPAEPAEANRAAD
jgi:beta-lactamase regulating signal transducer with metallopeptidase domain